MTAALVVLCGFAPAQAQNAVGMNVHIPADDELDAVQALGAGWIRIDNNWLSVEPRPGAYQWGELDRVVDGAAARGLRVMMTIAYTPAWASAGDSDGASGNDLPRAGTFDRYVAATVARYRDRVSHYGIWNEPNLPHFFEGSLEQYVDDVLRPGAAAVREACPTCVVLGPDLAGVSGWQPYLSSVLAAAADSIDVLAHHTYAAAPGVRPGLWICDDFVHAIDNTTAVCFYKPGLRQILDQAGWRGEVWLTETGYRADPWDSAEAQEKQRLSAAGILALQLEKPWWTHTFFYELTDCRPAQPACEIDGFGFLRRQAPADATWADNFVVKPVFDWLRAELAENPAWGADAPPPPDPPPGMPPRIVAPRRAEGAPDGILDDWDDAGCVALSDYQTLSAPSGGAADLSARACAAWSDDALWLAVEVVDDVHAEGEAVSLWLGDSVQLAVDVDADAEPGAAFDDDDLEWTVALFGGASRVVAEHGAVAATAGVTRMGDRTRYELRAPLPGLQAERVLRASFLVNDNDGAGRKGWLQWTPGIGRAKVPAEFGEVRLTARAAEPPVEGPGPDPDASPPPPLPTPGDVGGGEADGGSDDGTDGGVEDGGTADARGQSAPDGVAVAPSADGAVSANGGDGDGCQQGPSGGLLPWALIAAAVLRKRRPEVASRRS